MVAISERSWLSSGEILDAQASPLAWAVLTSRSGPNAKPKFLPFCHNEVIDKRLRNLADHAQPLNRLVVVQPRQHGKSEFNSVKFPTWYLGHNPHHQIGVASYGAARAVKIGSASRDLFERWAPVVFNKSVSGDTASKKEWSIEGHGGGMISCGIDGRFNGERLDGIILDDLFKDQQQALSPDYRRKVYDWFTTTALPCIPDHGWLLIVNTRWMPDDLIGRLLYNVGLENTTVTGHPISETYIATETDFD